jgi:hypothetical protein
MRMLVTFSCDFRCKHSRSPRLTQVCRDRRSIPLRLGLKHASISRLAACYEHFFSNVTRLVGPAFFLSAEAVLFLRALRAAEEAVTAD